MVESNITLQNQFVRLWLCHLYKHL